MTQTTIAAAFASNAGHKLPGNLYHHAGTFYNVRAGAVRFVRAKNQETLSRRYGMTMEMAQTRHAASMGSIKPVPAKQIIKPIGRGGVADYLAYARRMGVIF